MIHRCEYESPIGRLTLTASKEAIVGLRMDDLPGGAESPDAPVGALVDHGQASTALLDEACRQLDRYFGGMSTSFHLPLDPPGTAFQKLVWRALSDIDYGESISYGELAARIERPGSARAVGAANGANPIGIIIPCHRVVGADGSLTGYAGGIERKRALLAHEARVSGRAVGRSLHLFDDFQDE